MSSGSTSFPFSGPLSFFLQVAVGQVHSPFCDLFTLYSSRRVSWPPLLRNESTTPPFDKGTGGPDDKSNGLCRREGLEVEVSSYLPRKDHRAEEGGDPSEKRRVTQRGEIEWVKRKYIYPKKENNDKKFF